MKRLFIFFLVLVCPSWVLAQSNLLYNGNFELTQSEFYYENLATNRFGLPGWEAFATGDANSWVQVSQASSNWRLDLAGSDADKPDFVGRAGLQTAVSNRVVVIPGGRYFATVTYDNEEPAGVSYFIDWFNSGGNKVASAGGLLDDPNGPLVFAPFTQRLVVLGIAPANAVRAGVRLECSNPDFVTATADNFVFGIQPVLTITRSGPNVVLAWANGPTFHLQQTSVLSPNAQWTDLGTQNPQTNVITSANSFYRLSGP